MRLIVAPKIRKGHIRPEIYGNFSEHLGRCIYNGVFVGKDSPIPNKNGMRTDVVEALKKMKLPVLRWPGGCFADEYHWKDGIGPQETRKKMVNTNWGGVTEDNSFGTHEFMELCSQIGCKAYINGNVGSGSVQEMSEWVEYLTSPSLSPMTELRKTNGQAEPWQVPYFGVGNESWGCGGNMTPEFYADEFRRYQTYVRSYGGTRPACIACGPGTNPKDPGYNWTKVLMEKAGRYMDGLSLHYYTTVCDDWNAKGSATDFDKETYDATIVRAGFMETLCRNHGAIMDLYDPECRVGLMVDEWGTWYDVEPGTNPGFLYMQDTMRDAIVAALTLNIFNRHCNRVHMANIAQLINVLQAVILTEGAKMVLTPTFHVFEMYKDHQGAQLVSSDVDCPEMTSGGLSTPMISHSASVDESGAVTLTVANCSADTTAPIELRLDGMRAADISARILTGDMHAMNDFSAPDHVQPVDFADYTCQSDANGSELRFTLPPCSVLTMRLHA